jgi:hypothetical protein
MRLNFLLIILFINLSSLLPQSMTDSAMYHKGLVLINNAKTTENYLESAFYFESLSREFPMQWLIPYYAGLSYIRGSQKALDTKLRDDLLDKAQIMVNRSFQLKPDEPELFVLQAFLYQVRLLTDPRNRAVNLSQKADATLKKAISADSNNPRAYFLLASNIYHTPAVFKGGPKNALPVFLKARDKFKMSKPELSFMPEWGDKENDEMVKICSK